MTNPFELAVVNAMRYLRVSYDEALSMSYDAYLVGMYVYQLQHEDDMERMHLSVWLSERVVTATDKKGRYLYKGFDDFYQRESERIGKRVNPELYRVAERLKALEKGGN